MVMHCCYMSNIVIAIVGFDKHLLFDGLLISFAGGDDYSEMSEQLCQIAFTAQQRYLFYDNLIGK